MNIKLILIGFFAFTTTLFSLENSIVPEIESLESGKALAPEKYSTQQYEEILSAIAKKKERIRIVNYNTLFNLRDQEQKELYKWPQRAPRITQVIEEMQPDLLSVQELTLIQRDDLLKSLSEKYLFFSIPPEEGHFNGIFYNKHRFNVIDSQIFHLSDKGADSRWGYDLVLLHLLDNITDQPVAIFTTHLSFAQVEKRISQAKKINTIISQFHKSHPEVSLILTGDFNTFPNRPDLKNLPFYDGDFTESILKKDLFVDAKNKAVLGSIGPLSSFTNEGENPAPFQGTGTPGVFLDHIFVTPEITVLIHAVNPAVEEGLWASDHMPIIADIALPESKKKNRTEQDLNL